MFRTWVVTGTSHNDRKSYEPRVLLGLRDQGFAGELSLDCTFMPPGTSVPFHYVMAAGLDQLVTWVTDGTPMTSAPAMVWESGSPGVLARDEYGIAIGGIRLAQVEVPIAESNGTNSGPGGCSRWGYTEPFDEQTLSELYRNHGRYVAQVIRVTAQNQRDGFILAEDAAQVRQEAARSGIGRP